MWFPMVRPSMFLTMLWLTPCALYTHRGGYVLSEVTGTCSEVECWSTARESPHPVSVRFLGPLTHVPPFPFLFQT